MVQAILAILFFYVKQKQTQQRPFMRMLMVLSACCVQAVRMVAASQLVALVNVMPRPLPPIIMCLMLCADGCLSGMQEILKLRPEFRSRADGFGFRV